MVNYSILLAVLLFSGSAYCGSSSASSGASSSSDGTGHTFTASSQNGQGTFHQQTFGPGFLDDRFGATGAAGSPGFVNPGSASAGFGGFNNGFPNQPGYYGPAYTQPNYGGFGNYGPGFHYPTYPNVAPTYQPSAPFGFQAPFGPQPLLTPHQYNQQLSQYLTALSQQYNRRGSGNGGTFAHSTPGASVYATSYNGPTNLYKRQQDYIDAWKQAQSHASHGSGPNYAYATGSYSPNSIHQTAGVSPPNKNKPNIDTRFEPEDNPSNKPNYFGISTSSFSSSANGPDGEYHKQGAVTAVNDNGKVTIHKIES